MSNPLGRQTPFPEHFDPGLLYPISRSTARKAGGREASGLFEGFDVWNCYELSWFSERGMPQVGIVQLIIPCNSPNIVESKSLKLFLGSLNSTKFVSTLELQECIQKHLALVLGTKEFKVAVFLPHEWIHFNPVTPQGDCIDSLELMSKSDTSTIKVGEKVVQETFHSHLLRTLCPVTGQPDWASVEVHYQGKEIIKESFLRYLVSLRNHQGFHEDICEMIFCEVRTVSRCDIVEVSCRFTRRGGIDINPIRTVPGRKPRTIFGRLVRQ